MKKITFFLSTVPIVFLIAILSINVIIFKADATSGMNQIALLLTTSIAIAIGFYFKVSFEQIFNKIEENIVTTSSAIFVLLLVGMLSGSWLLSGVIPTMIYYGLYILSAKYFLISCLLISSIVSLATGSSWTTSATIGIALIGIGSTLKIPIEMVAGAIISGAYFGDKISPLSDTTNLAPAVAGTDLYTHIKYMLITTTPTYLITCVFFLILGFNLDVHNEILEIQLIQQQIKSTFNINSTLMLIPIFVIFLAIKKVSPLPTLLFASLIAFVFSFIFQKELIQNILQTSTLSWNDYYKIAMEFASIKMNIPIDNQLLAELFTSKGMSGMLNTVWLILCAMAFGGAMEAIGALDKISSSILKLSKGIFGLFFGTTFTCILFNLTTSDQYLAIVVPGKMYKKIFDDMNLKAENLSRTLEDSGTVTSALVPWNTCGSFHSEVLHVPVMLYFPYAVFNYLSPLMTLFIAGIRLKLAYKNN